LLPACLRCRLLLDPLTLAASARSQRQPGAAAAAAEAEVRALREEGTTPEGLQYQRYRDLDIAREHELAGPGAAGRLLPPAGRMYFPAQGDSDGSDEGEGGGRGGRGGHGQGGYEGALPPPRMRPPPFPGAAGSKAAVPFDYGGDGGGEEEAADGGQYAAVGFSYAGQGQEEQEEEQEQQVATQQQQQQRQQQQPQEEAEPFVAPFFVPERLRRHLPATQRQYKVWPLLLPLPFLTGA
jgi:hypothetical protein